MSNNQQGIRSYVGKLSASTQESQNSYVSRDQYQNQTQAVDRITRSFSLSGYSEDTEQVLQQMIRKQTNNRDYRNNSSHEDFRDFLVNYLCNTAQIMKYKKKTLHLAIAIMDQVFYFQEVQEKKQQILIALVSLILAAKQEENDCNIPYIDNIILRMNNKFTREEYLEYEEIVFVQILKFSVNLITPYNFMQEFLHRGILSQSEMGVQFLPKKLSNELFKFFEKLAKEFIDFSLQHYEFNRFSPLTVASAAIACARKMYGAEQIWNEQMQQLTTLSWDQVQNCANLMVQLYTFDYKQNIDRILIIRKKFKKKISQFQNWYESPVNDSSQENDIKDNLSDQQNDFFISQKSDAQIDDLQDIYYTTQQSNDSLLLQKSYSLNDVAYYQNQQIYQMNEDLGFQSNQSQNHSNLIDKNSFNKNIFD